MCICVNFSDIEPQIVQQIRGGTLLPVLGAGFTCGCHAKVGTVLSGTSFYDYMIDQIVEFKNGDITKEELKKESFSSVSTVYHASVPQKMQKSFLRNHFTEVKLGEEKEQFLDIGWPYVYTLNIDDAIETNSRYKRVIYSNRNVRMPVFDEEKCVVKLHGDIQDMLTYEDSSCEIFDQNQYVASIKDNESLLKKLTHDYEYLNLIFIGCSLSEEIDILFSSAASKVDNNARYFCTIKKPSELEKIKLKQYGITHCVVFDTYEDIYDRICHAAEEASKIDTDDLESFKINGFSQLPNGFDHNKAYLFYGKSLIKAHHEVMLPSFFVSRNITDDIIKNIPMKSTQILVGRGCSGKTYVAADISRRVSDRDVFYFQSSERINDSSFLLLLQKSTCLIIVDSKVLTIDQLESVIRTTSDRHQRNNSFLIIESKDNRDLSGLLVLLIRDGVIKENEIPQYELKSKFSKNKTIEINEKLTTSTLGVFSEKKSIADNIIQSGERLIQDNRFSRIIPRMNTTREIASLIVLATKKKAYALDAINLDVLAELELQKKITAPLIEKESTWSFEKSASNNSIVKYVTNAEYWLYNQLDQLAKGNRGKGNIIDAYKFIVSRLIMVNGKPDLMHGERQASYKDYILFDNINQIFVSQNTSLIREIYESLNELLSTDPNYMHQRSKCYIRSAFHAKSKKEKKEWLVKAFRDASISYMTFEKRYEENANEKIHISAAHTLYTAALALCHCAKLSEYEVVQDNQKAVEYLYQAMKSPYNSLDFARKDKVYNYNNVVSSLVNYLLANPSHAGNKKTIELLNELLQMLILENG